MELITKAQRAAMRCNWDTTRSMELVDRQHDPIPVVRILTPDANASWLLTELSPDGDTVFGLCDLGLGYPELGYESLVELCALRGAYGLPVENDEYFNADRTLSAYYKAARRLHFPFV